MVASNGIGTVPPLSICILTYNRARFLPDLLESIAAQSCDELEVILSDDASSDATPEVAAAYAGRIKNFRYIRRENNIGLDRHFFAAVEAATGRYAWLMGDDDRLEPGAVQRVLGALVEWPEVGGLTLSVNDYDSELAHKIGSQLTPPTQIIHGAGKAMSMLADLMGFMSAMVVRRDAWLQIAADPAVGNYENLYVQVYMMGRVADATGTWGVIGKPCVGFRKNNDQFLAALAWRKRLAVDVIGYEQVAKGVLAADPRSLRTVRRKIFSSHIMARLRGSKDQPDADKTAIETARFLFQHYKDLPEFWLKGLPCVLAPSSVFRFIRSAYRIFAKRRSEA